MDYSQDRDGTLRWGDGSLGEMRVESLLGALHGILEKPVAWLPLQRFEGREITREGWLDCPYGVPGDESSARVMRECLAGVLLEVNRLCERAGMVVVDVPGRWMWMWAQGTVGPVRVALIRDFFSFRMRVGMRVKGIPYLLKKGEEAPVAISMASRSSCASSRREGARP